MSRIYALCALGLGVTALFFPALQAYLRNYLYYDVSLAHVVFWLAALALGAAAALALLARLAPRVLGDALAALFLGIAFFAWIKGAFLAWDYGMLFGDSVNWAAYMIEGDVDVLVLALCAGGALAFRRMLLARATQLVAFLAVVQVASLALLTPLAQSSDRDALLAKRTLELEPRASEKISEGPNVIILVVDTLQSDVVAQWLAAQPRRSQALPGFTFFRDALAEGGVTWLSLPNALTGTMFDNQVSYPAYLNQAFHSPASMLMNLRSAGYHVELQRWTYATPVPLSPALLSNIRDHGLRPALAPLKSMLMLGGYTVMPQFAQERLHPTLVATAHQFIDADTDNNLRFIRDTERLPVERVRQPVAKLIHLRGPHIPLLEYGRHGFDYQAAARDETLAGGSKARFTRPNYERVSEEMLEAVVRYLRKLERAGAYDRSMIFVFGDHGAGRLQQRFIPPRVPPYDRAPDTVSSGLQAAAAAALMVKAPGATGPLRISDAPVALSDIAATVNRFLGKPAGPGLSLLEPLPAARERRYVDVAQIRFDADGRLPPLTEYRVGAPMWRDASWQRTGRRFLAQGVRAADPPYLPGELLVFGDGTRALDYLDYGWRVPMRGVKHMWTDGRRASLALPLEAPLASGGVLEMEAGPYELPRRAQVSVNGVRLGELQVDEKRLYSIRIPPGLVHRELRLRLDLPDAVSPYARLGLPDDGLLSLQVFWLRVSGAN